MNGNYDVVVVGAGNGGLSAGALLAKNGKKVLIAEKHNLPGGAATSFVRGRFEFEPSLHELAQIGTEEAPGGVRQLLNALGVNVDWKVHLDGTFRLIVPEEGIDAEMPCGVENFIEKMEELVPGSKDSMTAALELSRECSGAFMYMLDPAFTESSLREKFPHFDKCFGNTIHDVLDSLGMPIKAQHIFSSYWCYLGATEEEMSFGLYANMLYLYITEGAGMPANRSHEMSLSFEKAIRDNGGEIWYNTKVDRILVKDGKAYGVAIGDKEIYCDQVISNVYPHFVYGNMIDSDQVPEKAVRLANNRELGLSFVTVYLGMNKSAEELGIHSYSNFVSNTSDSVLQKQYATGTCEYSGYAIMNCLNVVNPGCTPEGTCQLFFTTFFFGNGWDKVSPEQYQKQKEKVALDMIKDIENKMGLTLLPYIEEIEIAAPPTFARYLGSPQGTPYGYQMNVWDDYSQRMFSNNDENFIENLNFVGASSCMGDGYSTAFLSGMLRGTQILMKEQMEKEVR